MQKITVQLERSGDLVVTFTVGDQPSLVMRRLELIAPAATWWEHARDRFSAEFPWHRASRTGGGTCEPGAALRVELSRRARRTAVRIRAGSCETTGEALLPPREAYRAELHDALDELLAERTATVPSDVPGAVFHWTLSTLTLFGIGEEFLLRLRSKGFRRPLLDRWPGPWRRRVGWTPPAVSLLVAAAAFLALVFLSSP